jgi:hypothetical protein
MREGCGGTGDADAGVPGGRVMAFSLAAAPCQWLQHIPDASLTAHRGSRRGLHGWSCRTAR